MIITQTALEKHYHIIYEINTMVQSPKRQKRN
jgi:hypothetical protein